MFFDSPKALAGFLQMPRRVHLVGVAGSGMCGLARMLLDAGHQIQGSDLKYPESSLTSAGLYFYHGHNPEWLRDVDLVVYSSAIPASNPERAAARERGIPEVHRACCLAALCEGRKLILVAGTHGKSTTTAMLALVLNHVLHDVGWYIGATPRDLPSSAKLGSGSWVVVEGDESDGSIQLFNPEILILLNLEAEHLEYHGSFDALVSLFADVSARTQRVICLPFENKTLNQLVKGAKVLTYGWGGESYLRVAQVERTARGSSFVMIHPSQGMVPVRLHVPGDHNVANALAAATGALAFGLDLKSIAEGLSRYRGIRRRIEVVYEDTEILVLDDYAHHPTEVSATLQAVSGFGCKRILATFQPHRFSRTQQQHHLFGPVFASADRVFITRIYPSNEAPIPGVNADLIVKAVEACEPGKVVAARDLDDARRKVLTEFEPGDAIVTMGAGDIHKMASDIAFDCQLRADLVSKLSDQCLIKFYEPMSRHTTIRIGGPALFWYQPGSEMALCRAVQFAKEKGISVLPVGRGSNLVVGDEGIRALCVHLGSEAFKKIRVEGDTVYAGAGARLKDIVHYAKREGVGGFEFMEGIPGSLGGALRMNAGAMQSWMFEVVVSIRWLTDDGKIEEIEASKLDVRYRDVPALQKAMVLGARLKGVPRQASEIQSILNEYSEKRWASQPAAPSAGCIFKNPPGIPAGKLIDELGLKGLRVGDASLSTLHGNFIINEGHARCQDVLELVKRIQGEALDRRGITLETEAIFLTSMPL